MVIREPELQDSDTACGEEPFTHKQLPIPDSILQVPKERCGQSKSTEARKEARQYGLTGAGQEEPGTGGARHRCPMPRPRMGGGGS